MSKRTMGINQLTEENKEKILTAIRGGNFLTTAAAMCGINRRTVNRWKERGEEDLGEGKNNRYTRFFLDFAQAEADGEFLLVNKVLEGGPKLALQVLKRRYRKDWGDKIASEISGPGGGPIETRGKAVVNLTMQMPAEQPWIDETGDQEEEQA